MGTRSQVHFVNSGVYLYQHWDGDLLSSRVQRGLSLNERWDDEEYLTRIIFDSMKSEIEAYLKKEYGEKPYTGFGIGTDRHWDIEYLVEIDVEKQTIEVLSGFGDDMTPDWIGTFEQFVKKGDVE
jgi:hypothetical protein